jgi:serine/threonine protein kinase
VSVEAAAGGDAERVLGRYRVMSRLAQGGMGVVDLGRLEGAAGFAKPVVIKRIIPDGGDLQDSTARFIREAQILSNLQHAGIVGVLDFGEEGQSYAMILEYVHGYDLGRWLKYLQLTARSLHWEEAIFISLRVLEALSYAHEFRLGDGVPAEVLHRDISPGNVLLDVDGRVRLLDFGIARMAKSDGDLFKTQTGVLKGKVAFLAPELFSSSPPSAASDIYAWGVVLYQMLAGTNPFSAENDSRVMWRIIMEAPQPLTQLRSDLPPELDAAVLQALAKEPQHRHASAEVFAGRLRRILIRSEAEIGSGLRERIRADFNGEMPMLLRLEPLADRDRAWRHDAPPGLYARAASRLPPAVPATERSSSQETESVRTRRTPRPRARMQPELELLGPAQTLERAPGRVSEVGSRRGPRSRRLEWKPALVVGLGMGALVIALMAVLLLYVLRHPTPSAARFIVIESPAERAALPDEPLPARALPAAGPAPVPPLPPAGAAVIPAPLSRGADQRSDEAALSARFARREGELQRCFDRFASELRGQPQLAIKFAVAASGEVTSATLSPSSLAPTPLGKCLVAVASSTRFGAQQKRLRFSIPIRARAVQR